MGANILPVRHDSFGEALIYMLYDTSKYLCKLGLNIIQINGLKKKMDTIVCHSVNVIGSASQIGSEKLAGRKEGSDEIINLLTCSLI